MNVYFIRHAKSSWNNAHLSDIERPLNARGLETAPRMATYLANTQNLGTVAIFSSPAERAHVTAKYFAEALGIEDSKIVLNEKLYYGSAIDYIHCINSIQVSRDSVLIFGHNPTLEELASQFKNPYIGLVPTCCVIYTVMNNPPGHSVLYQDFEIQNIFIPKLIIHS